MDKPTLRLHWRGEVGAKPCELRMADFGQWLVCRDGKIVTEVTGDSPHFSNNDECHLCKGTGKRPVIVEVNVDYNLGACDHGFILTQKSADEALELLLDRYRKGEKVEGVSEYCSTTVTEL